MGLKRYDVEVNGYPTTLQLSDEDAERLGLTGKDASESKAKTPANKSRTPANKTSAAEKRAEAESRAFGGKKG